MENKITGLKVSSWFDKPNNEIMYGVDARVNGRWCHLKNDEGTLLFQTKKEAAAKIKLIAKEQGVL